MTDRVRIIITATLKPGQADRLHQKLWHLLKKHTRKRGRALTSEYNQEEHRMSDGALEQIAHQLEQIAIEQYTANLIAIAASHRIIAGIDYADINAQIVERMGLA